MTSDLPPPAGAQPAHPQQQEHRQRLVIGKMVLTNFKSYAGTVEVGPFHTSFTSVVGPNGSGKSNVIDALLFVFGFRASKMRQAKNAELIHSSAQHPGLDFCEVAVHFHEIVDLPTGGFRVVPDSQLVVARKAFRDSTTKYLLDGRHATKDAVKTLLMRHGVDLDHNRFLILQGEVESIAQMKPKAAKAEENDGLLEYLEDIVGTSDYKPKLAALEAELEEISGVRAEKLNRVRVVENDKNALEDGKNEAETYVRTENEVARKQSLLYQTLIHRSVAKMGNCEEKIAEHELRLDEEKAKYAGVLDSMNKMTADHDQKEKECDKLANSTSEIAKEFEKFERDDVKAQENKKHLKGKLKKLTKSLEDESRTLSETQTWLGHFEGDCSEVKENIASLNTRLANEEQELDKIRQGLRGKTDHIQIQIEKKQQAELNPLLQRMNDAKKELDVNTVEMQLLEEQIAEPKRRVAELTAALDKLAAGEADKKEELDVMNAQSAELQSRIQELKGLIKQKHEQIDECKKKLKDAQSQADEIKMTVQQKQSQNQILARLMNEKDSGRLPGIYGRLGDLGIIDAKYDVAISTACPSLNDIVVDTVETGQKCINYLRQHQLGRARFICLNKLPRYDVQQQIRKPCTEFGSDVDRLMNLVTAADDMFLPALYHVLSDTLVAPDLARANQIAFAGKRRNRVVTLTGQLIDASGTMSGGGTRVIKGLMAAQFAEKKKKQQQPSSGSTQEISAADAEREQAALQHKMKKLAAEKQALEAELQQLEPLEPEVALQIKKLAMELASNQERAAEIRTRQLPELQKHKADPAAEKRFAELAALTQKQRAEVDKISAKTAQIERDVKQLQEQILEIGGLALRMQQVRVDELNEEIATANGKLTQLQIEQSTKSKAIDKLTKSLDKKKKEEAEIADKLAAIEAEVAEKTQLALAVTQRLEAAKAELEDKREELANIKAQINENREVVNKSRRFEVELENKIADLRKVIKDESSGNEKRRAELRKLKLNEYATDDGDDHADQRELPTFTAEEVEEVDTFAISKALVEMEALLRASKPNLSILEEYREKNKEYLERARVLAEITERRDEVQGRFDELRKKRLDEFMAGFRAISQKLKEMYQMITLGGNAELELVDSLDPFSEGIQFSVMPPKKSWKNISNLSGGEKTLSSLALVFALHHFKPTPLYVMDEIDAALDFRNVSIVANYIKERTRNAQFVIISLRNNMFELADRLVGIYKTNNCTKSITIDPVAIAEQTATSVR